MKSLSGGFRRGGGGVRETRLPSPRLTKFIVKKKSRKEAKPAVKAKQLPLPPPPSPSQTGSATVYEKTVITLLLIRCTA